MLFRDPNNLFQKLKLFSYLFEVRVLGIKLPLLQLGYEKTPLTKLDLIHAPCTDTNLNLENTTPRYSIFEK